MSATRRKRADGEATIRDARDFYRTPPWAVRAIAPHLPVVSTLDAGCGDGSIMKTLLDLGWLATIQGVEIDPNLHTAANFSATARLCSFFDVHESFDLVISNPPYAQAEAFVRYALKLVAPRRGTVAMLLRLAFLEGQARAALHREHPSDVYVLPRRPSFTGGTTDATAYAWFVWAPGRGYNWHILDCEGAK